jgi:hypothetical protein
MLILEGERLKEAEAYILKGPVIVQGDYSYEIHELIEANEEKQFSIVKIFGRHLKTKI